MRKAVDTLAKGMEKGRIMEASLFMGTGMMTYSYYRLVDMEMQCQMFSAKKEDLLNMAQDIASSHLSLEDPKVLKEISYQLSFIEEVIAWYSTFKCDGGNVADRSAMFASGCSAVGFFSPSSIIMGAKRSGMSIKELFSAGSGTLSWYGAGFLFHFMLLMTSFYVRDELRVDQQWLAQLLLCYRSSLLRMIILLNHYLDVTRANADGDVETKDKDNSIRY